MIATAMNAQQPQRLIKDIIPVVENDEASFLPPVVI
jgi:hypothetical protein